jgi:hypothetical protein
MNFNGVELLKMQFSHAINQTFESFLDSWSLPMGDEGAAMQLAGGGDSFATEVPVNTSSLLG